MRIRWRGLELPSRVLRDETVSTDSYGRFRIEPFEQGFGTTVGNSLRRVLLSSLEGAAVTTVKIEGVPHEFTSIEGVIEDVTDIILNIKGIVLKMTDAENKRMTLSRTQPGLVKPAAIEPDPAVTIVDPDHVIATMTENVAFHVEMTVQTGRGYTTAAENRRPEQELGVIPIDSIFSPVLRVRYRTEAMRVGQRTNYDRLILEVWTKGTVLPEDALVEAGMILRKHLNPFVMYHELGSERVSTTLPVPEPVPVVQPTVEEHLDRSVSVLNLSVRASNCMEMANITTLRELVQISEADLLRFRSFGKTSLHEVQRKLSDCGLSLGMRLEDEDGSGDPLHGMQGENEAPGESETQGEEEDEDSEASNEAQPSGGSVDSSAGPKEVFTLGE